MIAPLYVCGSRVHWRNPDGRVVDIGPASAMRAMPKPPPPPAFWSRVDGS